MPSPLGLPALFFSLLMGAAFFAISGIGLAFPIAGLTFLMPLPILWAHVRHGIQGAFLAALAGGAAHLLLLGDSLTPLLMSLAQGAVPGLMMGAALSAGATAAVVVMAGASGHIAAYTVVLALVKRQTGQDPAALIAGAVSKSAEQIPAAVWQMQGLDAASYTEMLSQMIRVLFPAFTVVGAFVSVGVLYLVARALLGRREGQLPPLTPFGQWRLPLALGLLWLLSLVVWGVDEFGRRLAANAFLLLSLAYLVQGAAVAHFFLSQRLPRLLSGVLVVLVAFFPPVFWIATLVGITDAIFNFRRLGPKVER